MNRIYSSIDEVSIAQWIISGPVMSRIDHPNIAKVFSYGKSNDDILFIETENTTPLENVYIEDINVVKCFYQIISSINYLNHLGLTNVVTGPHNITFDSNMNVKLTNFNDTCLSSTVCNNPAVEDEYDRILLLSLFFCLDGWIVNAEKHTYALANHVLKILSGNLMVDKYVTEIVYAISASNNIPQLMSSDIFKEQEYISVLPVNLRINLDGLYGSFPSLNYVSGQWDENAAKDKILRDDWYK